MPQSPALDFEKLAPYAPREFLPEDVDLESPDTVVRFYQLLAEREPKSPEGLDRWLADRSELDAALSQRGSILYIRMTCQTDNPDYAQRYQRFVKEVSPAVKPWTQRCDEQYLRWRKIGALPQERVFVYDRGVAMDVKLFREENIPLQTELDLLSQEYQKIFGAMTLDFEGETRTLPQMGKILEETDRKRREAAWRAVQARRLADREKLDDVFHQMVAKRHRLARQAGFDNFRDYQFAAYHRFDYSPADCRCYHEVIERVVLPLSRERLSRRARLMGLDHLRPWDTHVDPLGRSPLRPFSLVNELVEGVGRVFHQLDQGWAEQFARMAQDGFLDLESRPGKAPGGYQSALDESRKPFIFMNAVGMDSDVKTLLHESGHAFHALACAPEPWVAYRHAPMEFNEVASMGMELLAGDKLDVFYSPEDLQRSWQNHLEDVVHILVWVAVIDAFQHLLYENPDMTPDERHQAWLKVHQRFDTGLMDWSGLETERATLWHRQLHIFEVPFYYIEYGIAQLGALQLWRNYRQDPGSAVKAFQSALDLGGSRPLPVLYETAGLKFDFSERVVRPLVDDLYQALTAAD